MQTVQDGRAKAATITAAAGVPLHRQLYLVLHDEIGRGVLAPGAALPTEQSLCDQFGISRITVRRALADLADAGLIERRHGVGSFVLAGPPAREIDGGGSYLDELRQVEFETGVDVVELDVREPPSPVADRLGVADRALYLLRVRRARRTNEPLMITEAWLPEVLAEIVTEATMIRLPLYRVLADSGIVIERIEHELTAEIAGPRTAQLLDTTIGAPLIRVNQVAFVDAIPHHFLSIVLSPNRSRVVIGQSAAELASGTGLAIAHDVHRPG
jgi:GntR family transcriptional regulator